MTAITGKANTTTSIRGFLQESFRLVRKVFISPKSLRQEIETKDSGQKRRLLAQAVLVAVLTPLLLTLLMALLLQPVLRTESFPLLGLLKIELIVLIGVLTLGVSLLFSGNVAFLVAGGISVGIWGVLASLSQPVPLRNMIGPWGLILTVVAIGVTMSVTDSMAGHRLWGSLGCLASVIGVLVYMVLPTPLWQLGGIDSATLLKFQTYMYRLQNQDHGPLVSPDNFVYFVGIVVLSTPVIGAAFFVGYSRLFLLPFEAFSTAQTLKRARQRPQSAKRLLLRSLAYRDEIMPFPQPFLTPLVALVVEQDRDAGIIAIVHLINNTFQKRAAIDAQLELDRGDLLGRHTAEEIAHFAHDSAGLSPNVVAGMRQGITEAHYRCIEISSNVGAALSASSSYQKQIALERADKQLDDLRAFTVRSLRGKERELFAQVAQQWLGPVKKELRRLTEAEGAAETIPNPYVAPRPLRPSDAVFVDRAEVFRFIEEHFLRMDQDVSIILYGQPRIGKSSILAYLTTHLPTHWIPVNADMQRVAQVETTGGLLFNLADAIGQELARRGMRLPVPTLSEYNTAEPFIVFGKFLDDVETALHAPDHRIILALDEFEEIERKLVEGKVSRDLMPFLRNIMQHRRGIALLFAGTHNLDEMIQDDWIAYFRSAVPCRVSYLTPEAANKLIIQPIEAFPLVYDPEAVTLLMETTHCHPCLIQLACSAMVSWKNEQRSHHASVEDVERVLTQTLESGEYVFRGIWNWIPSDEHAILSALARETRATARQLARTTRKSEEEVQVAMLRLVEVEVIEAAPGSGVPLIYQFQMELFRQWVERYTARSAQGQP